MAITRLSYSDAGNALAGYPNNPVTVPSCAVGDTILVLLHWQHATVTLSSIICSGETLTQRGSQLNDVNDSTRHWIWYTINSVANAGNKVIDSTLSTYPDWHTLYAWRLSGVNTAAPLDAGPVTNSGSSPPTQPTGDITTVSANAGVFAFFSGATDKATGVGAGYLLETSTNTATYFDALSDPDVGAAGVKTANFTGTTSSASWFWSGIALASTGGGGGGINLNQVERGRSFVRGLTRGVR